MPRRPCISSSYNPYSDRHTASSHPSRFKLPLQAKHTHQSHRHSTDSYNVRSRSTSRLRRGCCARLRRPGCVGARRWRSGGNIGNGDAGLGAEFLDGGSEFYELVISGCFCKGEEYGKARTRGMGVSGSLLATSSALHLFGAHPSSEFVMLSRPVVHWHFVSVKPHPESGIAEMKHGI